MDANDLSYIAGFFDGEGTATIRMVKGPKDRRYPRLEARIAQNDRAVLDWISEQYGFGKVYEKPDNRTVNMNHGLQFYYRQARVFLTSIEPYLKVKKDHVKMLLDEAGRQT